MPPSIDLDKIFLNISLFIFWYSISFQSICATTFSFILNLIAVSVKLVRITVWLLRIPILTNLQSLTGQKNGREKIKLSSICGDLLWLKDLQVV